MLLEEIRNKKIVIVGLGTENLQFLQWLKKVVQFKLENIFLADKQQEGFRENLKTKLFKLGFSHKEVVLLLNNLSNGKNYLKILENPEIEWVIKSPGIWSLSPEFVEFRGRKSPHRVVSSLCFFFEKFRSQIVAITGTKGKSTTSNLTNHILNNLSKSKNVAGDIFCVYCGNSTGTSPYFYWKDLDQQVDSNYFFVVEISSFQLQDLGFSKISPKYGVITNIYLDHQDQHQSLQEYWNAKFNIFKFQKKTDYLFLREPTYQKIQKQRIEIPSNIQLVTSEEVDRLKSIYKSFFLGDHSYQNLSLSLNLAKKIYDQSKQNNQIDQGFLADILQSYVKLPHRLELVSKEVVEVKNLKIIVKFFDDASATEPNAVLAAIDGLTKNSNEFVWLQMAGLDKGGDIYELIKKLNFLLDKKIYRLSLAGKIGQKIYQKLDTYLNRGSFNISKIKVSKCASFKLLLSTEFNSLEEIVQDFFNWFDQKYPGLKPTEGANNKKKHKIVLNIVFSPAGSSFDEFENYVDRAKWWLDKVKKL